MCSSGRERLNSQDSTAVDAGAQSFHLRVHTSAMVIGVFLGAALGAIETAPRQQPMPQPVPQAAPSVEKPIDPALRDVLQQYAAALESLDADAVKKVQPSIDLEGLKRAFREMRSLDVNIDNLRLLSSDPNTARVSCRVAQTLTPKAGSRQTTEVTRVLLLRRQESGWIIQAFER